MNEPTRNPTPKFTAQRKAWVWQYVKRCIDKAQDADERRRDAYTLVGYQIDDASDKGGRE